MMYLVAFMCASCTKEGPHVTLRQLSPCVSRRDIPCVTHKMSSWIPCVWGGTDPPSARHLRADPPGACACLVCAACTCALVNSALGRPVVCWLACRTIEHARPAAQVLARGGAQPSQPRAHRLSPFEEFAACGSVSRALLSNARCLTLKAQQHLQLLAASISICRLPLSAPAARDQQHKHQRPLVPSSCPQATGR